MGNFELNSEAGTYRGVKYNKTFDGSKYCAKVPVGYSGWRYETFDDLGSMRAGIDAVLNARMLLQGRYTPQNTPIRHV